MWGVLAAVRKVPNPQSVIKENDQKQAVCSDVAGLGHYGTGTEKSVEP